ncbi:hypothetical protein KKC1_06020 [Calderihabitans maritimus]|uniref:Uncharacterized protein n=1 Tax=Calderihabitans maritimus TaxID=1246530 RepID=A0A1Z5HQ86_9FIRM|nr:hypothetical protein KKC1_06020 [Calderihabitans maritimus]
MLATKTKSQHLQVLASGLKVSGLSIINFSLEAHASRRSQV